MMPNTGVPLPPMNGGVIYGTPGVQPDMQHQAVAPYHGYTNNFDQYYQQQQQQQHQQQQQQQQHQQQIGSGSYMLQQQPQLQPLPVQQPPHANQTVYYSPKQSPYQVPSGGGPNVNAGMPIMQEYGLTKSEPFARTMNADMCQQAPPPVQQQQQQLASIPAEFPTTITTLTNSGKLPAKSATWKSNEARRPKNYYCPACNKGLSSRGHLKRHYNTPLHKNAVKSSGKPDPSTLPISAHYHPQRGQATTTKPRRNNSQAAAAAAAQQQPVQPPETSRNPLRSDFPQGATSMGHMSKYSASPLPTQQTQQAQMNGIPYWINTSGPATTVYMDNIPLPVIELDSITHELASTTDEIDSDKIPGCSTDTIEAKKAQESAYTTKKGSGRSTAKRQRVSPACTTKPPTETLPNGRIKCLECNKDFSQPCYLTQHLKSYHSGACPYRCIFCGKRFQTAEAHATHISRHVTKGTHRCDNCSKQFHHKSDLGRHVRNEHTNVRLHVCPICDKGFSRNDHLGKHIETHNKPKRVPASTKSGDKKVAGQETVERTRRKARTEINETNKDGDTNRANIDGITDFLNCGFDYLELINEELVSPADIDLHNIIPESALELPTSETDFLTGL